MLYQSSTQTWCECQTAVCVKHVYQFCINNLVMPILQELRNNVFLLRFKYHCMIIVCLSLCKSSNETSRLFMPSALGPVLDAFSWVTSSNKFLKICDSKLKEKFGHHRYSLWWIPMEGCWLCGPDFFVDLDDLWYVVGSVRRSFWITTKQNHFSINLLPEKSKFSKEHNTRTRKPIQSICTAQWEKLCG